MPLIKPIRTPQDYDAAQARATELLLASPSVDSEEGQELDILATLIAAYDHQQLTKDDLGKLKQLRRDQEIIPEPRRPLKIRAATPEDLAQINLIYDHYVHSSTATYQTSSRTERETAAWFAAHGEKHPVIVTEIDGRVVGWGSLSPFHARAAFDRTVEESVYIHQDFHRRGVGKAILTELLKRAKDLGHHRVIAAISGDQEPSLALHESMGFTERGRLTEVGFKFGRWLDLVYLEYRL